MSQTNDMVPVKMVNRDGASVVVKPKLGEGGHSMLPPSAIEATIKRGNFNFNIHKPKNF